MSDSPPRIVMISSTCRDLPRHREEVRSACEELRCLPRMMEHLPASDDGAVDAAVAWCREGPRGARVEAAEVSEEPPAGEREFRIR